MQPEINDVLDGVLDNFRIWAYERTAEHILENMHLSDPQGDAGLLLSLTFEDGPGSSVARDLSTYGHHAVLGRFPDPVIAQEGSEASRKSHELTPPQWVTSSAPSAGDAVEVQVLPGSPGSPFSLKAWTTNGTDRAQAKAVLDSLPLHGTLLALEPAAAGAVVSTQVPEQFTVQPEVGAQLSSVLSDDGGVIYNLKYVPGPSFSAAGEENFTFTIYSDTDGSRDSGVVRILPFDLRSPEDRSILVGEDEAVAIVLGGAFSDGTQAGVVVTSLPAAGVLYDAVFLPTEMAPPFAKYAAMDMTDRSAPITEDMLPHRVLDDEGTLLFVPPMDQSGMDVRVTYKHVHESLEADTGLPLETLDGTLVMSIYPVNDPPQAEPQVIFVSSFDDDKPVLLELSVTDIDPSVHETEFLISSPPRLGALLHMAPQARPETRGTRTGSPGRQRGPPPPEAPPDELQEMDFESRMFAVLTYPERIPPYDPRWGPAFSSQRNSCKSTCCIKQETCNEATCTSMGDRWPCRFIGSNNVLGESTFTYGENANRHSWSPFPSEGSENEFIVVQYEADNYVSSIEIHQLLSSAILSTISSISVSRTYEGNNTKWTPLWVGDPFQWRGLSSDISEISFKPPFACKKGAFGRFLRLDFRVPPGMRPPMITAIELQGSPTPARGIVMSPGNELYYRSTGFHGLAVYCDICGENGLPFDWFEVTPSDCESLGMPVNVSVGVSPPARPGEASTVEQLGQTLNATVGFSRSPLAVDTWRLWSLFTSAYGADVVKSCDAISHQIAVLSSGGAEFKDSLGNSLLNDGQMNPVLKSNRSQISLEIDPAGRAFERAELEVWSTFCGVTARFQVSVEAACPEDTVDPLKCALDSSFCPTGYRYIAEEKVCRKAPLSTQTVVLIVMLGLLCAILPLGVAAILLMRRNRRLKRNLKTLMREKDDTLDLDSPLTKVIHFLESLSTQIPNRRTRQQAIDLHMLLLSSDNIDRPTMQQVTNNLNDDMARFLLQPRGQGFIRRGSERGKLNGNLQQEEFTSVCSGSFSIINDAESSPSMSDHDEVRELSTEERAEADRLLGRIGEDWFMDSLRVLMDHQALQAVVMRLMDRWNLLRTLRVSPKQMRAYVERIQAGYQDNPYHNSAHAVDVTSRLGAILHHSGIGIALASTSNGALRLFATIVAAAVHDYEHPGVSNSYTVKMQMDVAKRFNDQATLENHALYNALEMMESDPENSLIGSISAPRKLLLRQYIISLVLGTDMGKHFELMTAFKKKVVDSAPNSGAVHLHSLSDDQMNLVTVMALKVADLGHNALPFDLHWKWLRRLEDEFFAQGDLEKQNSLEVSPLMDRDKPGPTNPQNQLGFSTFIMVPLYTAWCQAFPGCLPLKETIQENMEMWEKQVARATTDSVKLES